MAPDNRVRIVFQHQGAPHYFKMMIGDVPDAVPFDRIREAALLDREIAVALCTRLRARNFGAHIFTPAGVSLFDESTAPLSQTAKSEERVPMQCNGVLIVPGQPPRNGFYIRFPQTSVESLWAETAEAVYQKLVEHSLAAELIPLAEKFIPPPEPVVDPHEFQRSLQAARYGKIRRPDLV